MTKLPLAMEHPHRLVRRHGGALARMGHDGRVRTLRQTVLQPILLTLGKHANDINDSG